MSDASTTSETLVTEARKLSKHELFFEVALYDRLLKTNLEDDIFSGEVEGFNPEKKYRTTFTIQTSELAYRGRAGIFRDAAIIWERSREKFWDSSLDNVLGVALTCKQSGWTSLIFFIEDDESFIKVGQTPSIADLRFAEVSNKYEKELSKEDLGNYKRAIGLHSHGIGIGSYVYLRRIFETLISETFDSKGASLGLDAKTFAKLRMEDKVDALRTVLPSQLVEMKAIYSIMSKGIHQLTEKECLKYFLPIRFSIELILDQKIEEANNVRRDAEVKKAVHDALQNINK